MKQALGLVEIQGMSAAVVVADTMVKAANICIIDLENTKGLGYMTIKIAGDVGAVNAAVNAARQVGIQYDKLVSSKVIPRPSDYVEQIFCHPKPPAPDSSPEKKAEALEELIREPETLSEPEVPATVETEPESEQIEASETETNSEQVDELQAIAPESPADAEITGAEPETPEPKKPGKGITKTTGTPKSKK